VGRCRSRCVCVVGRAESSHEPAICARATSDSFVHTIVLPMPVLERIALCVKTAPQLGAGHGDLVASTFIGPAAPASPSACEDLDVDHVLTLN